MGLYGDIIIIAAIAAFILLRYRAMLGEKHGRDESDTPPPAQPLQEYERVIQLPEREARERDTVVALGKSLKPIKDYGPLNEHFTAMRRIDRQFNPDEFIEGARAAFEMVIDAYNEGDHETLKMLLAPDIYDDFAASLAAQQAQDHTQHTTLVAIVDADMTEAELAGNKARITVKFVSEQITLVRDTEGEIISGDPSQQEAVEDSWVFERNLTASDPSWKVIET